MSNNKLSTESINKRRWICLLFQILIGMATSFTFTLSVYIGPLNEVKGWNIQTILLTFTIAMWVGPVATIVGGKARDMWGNKKCIIIGGLLYGISVLVSGLVTSIVLFIVLQGIVTAFCMYAVYLSQMQNIAQLFPEMRGTALGILNGGLNLCSAALPILAVFLMDTTSVVMSIVIQGAIFSLACLLLGLFIFDPPEDYQGRVKEGEAMASEDEEMPASDFNITWRHLLKQPALYLIWAGMILITMVGTIVQSNMSLVAQEATGISEVKAAVVVTITVVAFGVGGIIMGYVADKIGLYNVFLLIAGLTAVITFIMVAIGISHLTPFVISVTLISFLFGGVSAIAPVLCMDAFGDRFFGVNMGIMTISNLAPTLIAPQMSVVLPLPLCFLLCGGMSAVGFFLFIVIRKAVANMHNNKALCETLAREQALLEHEENPGQSEELA